MARQLIVFDMDGVLVDVTESYRETIVRTVEHFTGARIAPANPGLQEPGRLQRRLEALASRDRAAWRGVEFQTVVDYFQGLFHGNGTTA
jgi:HAD superfamily phosphatase